jgi:hypothetical protein
MCSASVIDGLTCLQNHAVNVARHQQWGHSQRSAALDLAREMERYLDDQLQQAYRGGVSQHDLKSFSQGSCA